MGNKITQYTVQPPTEGKQKVDRSQTTIYLPHHARLSKEVGKFKKKKKYLLLTQCLPWVAVHLCKGLPQNITSMERTVIYSKQVRKKLMLSNLTWGFFLLVVLNIKARALYMPSLDYASSS